MGKPKFMFYIDVVGSCNLRCPSCPKGNSLDVVNERGVMSPTELDRILGKATSECTVTGVGLFNWTEPFLHPHLDEMVRVVNKYGLPCSLSTNLNITKPERYKKLLEAEPEVLHISLSGFNQESYAITHRGGQIEIVKKNMELLLQIKNDVKSSTRLAIIFHRYLSNLDDEDKVKTYCEKFNLDFQPLNALMLPLEKVLAYCGESKFPRINEEDEKIIANLALPLKQALASARHAETKTVSCELLEQQITLNYKGDVLLCCAAYSEKQFVTGNYLEDSLETIQGARRGQGTCSVCTKHGVSNYYLFNIPDMDALVTENIEFK